MLVLLRLLHRHLQQFVLSATARQLRSPDFVFLVHATAPLPCRFIDGYTIRTYTLKGLILQDVAPPLDEISRFNAAGQAENDDMNVS